MKKTFLKTVTMILLSASLGVSCLSLSFAAESPLKLSSDSRIEVVAYSPYNVVPIHGTTLTATQITFSRDETIESVQTGDLAAWTASINKDLPYMLFVKPTVFNSNTNMTVITNKHTYYFQLTSNAKGEGGETHATYAVHFIYPQERAAQVAHELSLQEQQRHAEVSAFKNPSAFNWNYSFHGNKSIMPLHVFDDGKFTYLQLRPNQPVPAIFAVTTPDGKESVVNFRRDGNFIVVQRTAPEFTLRAGKGVAASIFNNRLIAKLRS
jgi:type IV secretion system protein VirB9